MSPQVESTSLAKTTYENEIGDLQYRFDGTLAKEKKVITDLIKLQVIVKKFFHEAKLFRQKMQTYIASWKDDVYKRFVSFLTIFQDIVRALVNGRHYTTRKSIDINFSVVSEIPQVIETGRSHPGRDLDLLA